MKIYEITEAIRPEHLPILNRMRAAGDKKSTVLANLIQAELQKANVPWDVAAELARDRYRELEDKKLRNRGAGGWSDQTHGHLRTGSGSGSTAEKDKPSNIRTRQDKKFSSNKSASLSQLDRADAKQGTYKSYDVDAAFGSPAKKVSDLISKGADAVKQDADDKSKGVLRRTPSKLAALGIDAYRTAKDRLTPKK
jgi:hypothetical protein